MSAGGTRTHRPRRWRWRPRTVRGRLTAAYALMLVAMLLLLWACVFGFVRGQLQSALHRETVHGLTGVERVLREDPSRLPQFETDSMIEYFRVRQGHRVVYASEDWIGKGIDRATPDDAHSEAGDQRGSWLWTSPDQRRFLVASKLTRDLPGGPSEIMVAFDTAPVDRTLSSLRWTLLLVIPVALMLGGAGGHIMAGRALAPVGAMAAKASEITAERLSERLPVDNPEDEFGRLAMAVNATFARLEASFDILRRFTADASHELRTPLTAIQSVGEVALREGEAGSRLRREAIGSMLEEVERLTRLVDGLLTLARGDAGAVRLSPETIDLLELAQGIAELLRVLAEDKNQELTVAGEAGILVLADRTTLRHAVLNLIENAIKYTAEGGTVSIVVARDGAARPMFEVSDNGPGIDEEHCAHVFDRFYRVAPDRSSSPHGGVGGTGLGLAIARSAARANGAEIELRSMVGKGCTFTLTFDGEQSATGTDEPRAALELASLHYT